MADSALSAAPETSSEERNDLPPRREPRPLPSQAQILRRIGLEDALRGPREPEVQPALEPGGMPIPFLQAERTQSPAGPTLSPEEVERRAKEMAAEVDRRLAREQPDVPKFPPVRGEVREPVVTGGTTLPFYSALVDPARVTGARHREIKAIEPRTTECVACEYRKLDTRLGDPAALGIDEKTLTPAQRQHFGYGERLYNLCQLCHDANGMLHPVLFDRLVQERMHEDRQRTFRHDPAFADVAERVAAVDSWRRGVAGVEDLGSAVRESQSLDAARAAALEDDGEYDGRDLDNQVMRLSDFTGQTPGEGRGSPGHPDPLFSNHDAHYDPARIGADEAAAYLMDEEWEARRKENFRRAWAATDEIEDPAFRHQVRARLVERWDPRMGLAGEDRMVEVNLFAEPRPRLAPYTRSATHSGVDEGFSSEPEWKKNALARHEAGVERFMRTVRGKLAGQGLPAEKIQELTALPELNPGREIVKFRHESPLRQRIAEARAPHGPLEEWTTPEGKKVWGRVVLPPKDDLEVAVAEGELRRSVMDAVNHLGNLEAARGQVDADTFLLMARRVQMHQELQARVREANDRREEVQRWSSLLQRADVELEGATRSFAREIRETFQDPKAFQSAFTRLSDEQKRHALAALRERPVEFARTFASGYGHDFGEAGQLATGGRQGSSAVPEIERAGVLTAEAGVRYLDAVQARRIATAHVARDLGLREGATPKEVREACSARLDAVSRSRSEAIRERESLGHVPSAKDLSNAFSGLHQQDRRTVLNAAEQDGAVVLSPADPEYPRLLADTPDRPAFLYVKGDLEPTRQRPVGVIGTREPTEHGQIIARRMTTYFAEKGWSIVSGLALGIDGIAHEAALDASGHTVAVLAHGLDTITPKRHTKLAERILASGGAWVTEYPYGTAPYGPNYVKRDRIQAGLSKAIVLIQTDVQGGSLHATRAALGYRRVVAYPVPTPTDVNRGEPKIQGVLKLHHGRREEVAEYLRCPTEALAGLRPVESKTEYPALEQMILRWDPAQRESATDLFHQAPTEPLARGRVVR